MREASPCPKVGADSLQHQLRTDRHSYYAQPDQPPSLNGDGEQDSEDANHRESESEPDSCSFIATRSTHGYLIHRPQSEIQYTHAESKRNQNSEKPLDPLEVGFDLSEIAR